MRLYSKPSKLVMRGRSRRPASAIVRIAALAERSVREHRDSRADIQMGRISDVFLPAFLSEFLARSTLGQDLREIVGCVTEGSDRGPRFG